MKRLFPAIVAGMLALAVLGAGCGDAKLPARAQPPKNANAAEKRRVAPKPRVQVFTGTIVAVDEATGSLTLKGSKSEMDFHVHRKARKQLEGLRLGDKMLVKHVDQTALSIVKLRTSSSASAPEGEKVSRREIDPSRVAL